MADRYRAPDGRVLTYGKPGDRTTKTSFAQRLGRLEPFIEACLAVMPMRPLSNDRRLGLFLFFLGAADRMWQRNDLDDARFPSFAARLLERHGVPAGAATALATDLPRLREVGPAREAMREGAEVFEQWMDGHDVDAVLRLNELIVHWDNFRGRLDDRVQPDD
jgi:hypothetical protein